MLAESGFAGWVVGGRSMGMTVEGGGQQIAAVVGGAPIAGGAW